MPKLTINTRDAWAVRPDRCTKCNRKRALFRHHMGNDAQLGRFNTQIAMDYEKYLDCVHLCNQCHMLVHYIYIPIVQAWTNFSPKGVLRLRAKLIDLCKLWIDGKIPDPDRSTPVFREFKRQWQESFVTWQRGSRSRKPRRATGTNGK